MKYLILILLIVGCKTQPDIPAKAIKPDRLAIIVGKYDSISFRPNQGISNRWEGIVVARVDSNYIDFSQADSVIYK